MSVTQVIGIAGCAVSSDPEGSCIAVTVHDHVSRVGGLLHLMLPESNQSLMYKPAVYQKPVSGAPIKRRAI